MFYDFKSENNEQEIVLSDIEELADDILDECVKLKRYEFLSVYANYEEIVMLIIKLYKDEALDILTELNNLGEYSSNKMMILTISYDDVLTVQEMINDKTGTVFYSEAILTYVYDSVCNLSVLQTLRSNDENILNYSYEKDFN